MAPDRSREASPRDRTGTIPAMVKSQQRLLILIVAVPVLIVLVAALYMLGMQYLEGTPRGFWRSLGWAAETLSTTGYGADSTWTHPAMAIFVILWQFAGVCIIFLIFPIYLIPFLEERFESKVPTEARPMRDHLVIYRSGPAVATLLGEIERAGIESLVIEPDEGLARSLLKAGRRVISGRLEDGVLERASIQEARTLIANGQDHENAAVILSARQLACRGEVIALVEEPVHRQPMMLAGATAAYSPRHVLGAALAAQARRRLGAVVSGTQQLGRHLHIREVRVGPASLLAGMTPKSADIGRRTGVTVLGQWIGGRLAPTTSGDATIEPNGILVLAGEAANLDAFVSECSGGEREAATPVVVAGHGEVGRKVSQLLRDAGEPVRIVDKSAPDADVVGDVLDPSVLERAEVRTAQAVVLALDSDPATLFATVIVRHLAPRVPIIARVNSPKNVERIHAAGADFALSISQVAGQLLARRLLGEEAIALDEELRVLKVFPGRLVGHHPADLGIRAKTGSSVVAVERGDEILVEFGPDFRFAQADSVFIAGGEAATAAFVERFGK